MGINDLIATKLLTNFACIFLHFQATANRNFQTTTTPSSTYYTNPSDHYGGMSASVQQPSTSTYSTPGGMGTATSGHSAITKGGTLRRTHLGLAFVTWNIANCLPTLLANSLQVCQHCWQTICNVSSYLPYLQHEVCFETSPSYAEGCAFTVNLHIFYTNPLIW